MKDINFLKEDIRQPVNDPPIEKSEGIKISTKAIIITIIAVILGLVVLFLPSAYLKIVELNVKIVNKSLADPKYAELNSVKNQLAAVDASLKLKKDIIRDIDSKGYPMTEVLNAVRQAIPKGCYLESVRCTNSELSISGSADDSLVVAEFISNLDRLSLISRKGKTESLSVEKANHPCKFSINCGIGKGGK